MDEGLQVCLVFVLGFFFWFNGPLGRGVSGFRVVYLRPELSTFGMGQYFDKTYGGRETMEKNER